MYFEFWQNKFYEILYNHHFCWSKYCTGCHNRTTEEVGTINFFFCKLTITLYDNMTLNMLTFN